MEMDMHRYENLRESCRIGGNTDRAGQGQEAIAYATPERPLQELIVCWCAILYHLPHSV